jgi:hypothetical protein
MRGLKPRIRPSLLIALADGVARCDRELMDIIHCDRRAVQRVLQDMHDQALVHIAGWMPAGDSYRWRPQYRLGQGDDVDCPLPVGRTSTQRVQQYRGSLSIEDKAFKDARRRQQRRVVKRDPLVAAFFGSVK